jgi:hypothetical protein
MSRVVGYVGVCLAPGAIAERLGVETAVVACAITGASLGECVALKIIGAEVVRLRSVEDGRAVRKHHR